MTMRPAAHSVVACVVVMGSMMNDMKCVEKGIVCVHSLCCFWLQALCVHMCVAGEGLVYLGGMCVVRVCAVDGDGF
jgi:hypothetical protein